MEKAISSFTNIVEQEIVMKKFPTEAFFEYYLSSTKIKENELLDERVFKKVVEQFKRDYKPKTAQQSEGEQPKVTIKINMVDFLTSPSVIPEYEIVVENQKPKEEEIVVPDEKPEGKLSIKCKQLQKTQLNDKQVKVILNEPKYDFREDLIIKVETPSEGWTVYRTYSDFKWLYNQLDAILPKQPIPALIGSYGCDKEKKRKKLQIYFQQFLDFILLNEELKANQSLIYFLSIEDREKFEEIQDDLSVINKPNKIEEYETLSGKVITDDNPDYEKYYTNIKNYADISSSLYYKMNGNLYDFNRGINKAVEALEYLQKDFETLNLMNRRVLLPENIIKTGDELGRFATAWSELLTKQKNAIRSYIKTYYKFILKQHEALFEECKDREEKDSKYKKKREELYREKYKLWDKKDIARYGIKKDEVDLEKLNIDQEYAFSVMKPKETKELHQLKKLRNLENDNLIRYLKIMLNYQKNDMINNLKNFYNEFCGTLSENTTLIESLKKFIEEVENIQKNPQTKPKESQSEQASSQ